MTGIPTLKTQRLFLRPLAVNDAADLFAIYSHPEAMRYWHTPAHSSLEDTRNLLQQEHDSPAVQWAICLHGDTHVIGIVEYLSTTDVPGMGYIMHPAYWNRGYTTEAMRAILDYGFQYLGIDRAELWVVSTNLASRRVAEKLNFAYKGSFLQKYANRESAHENVVYGLLKEEWQHTRHEENQPRIYSGVPVLPAHDIAVTVAYYRDVLGFRLEMMMGDPPSYASVSRGEWTADCMRIHFYAPSEGTSPDTQTMLYIFVSPIQALYDEYIARQVEVVQELALQPWGMREFRVRDINGMVLRFGEPA